MNSSRRIPIRRILIAIVVIGLAAWLVSVSLLGSRLEIGPETTFVTEPLKPDGSIDYPAALADRLGRGVNSDENAAILIDRAFGPAKIPPELRVQYFRWLGTDPLPEQGAYFVDQSSIIKLTLKGEVGSPDLNEANLKEFERAQLQPWTRIECPLAAEWLDANTGPLELIEQATKRAKYYSPLMCNDGLAHVQILRQAARLLSTRAMLRLGENNVGGAWSDLLACHRLSRLAGQRPPDLISLLVAVAIDAMATNGDAVLMAHGLSADQARTCLADHSRLPAFVSIAELIDQGERLNSLNSVIQQSQQTGLDANTMLRSTNRLYDDLVAALKKQTFAERQQAFAAIDADLKARIATARKPLRQATDVLLSSRRTKAVGDVLHSLFLPALIQTESAQMRNQIRRDLVQIGFALTAFHAEQGAYPVTLEELVPMYITAVPLDKFTEKSLVYVPRENDFLVYSVGENGQDDGGRMDLRIKADDVSFEIPPNTGE